MRIKSIPKASSRAVSTTPPRILPLRLHQRQPSTTAAESPVLSSVNSNTGNSALATPKNRAGHSSGSSPNIDLSSLTNSAALLFNLFSGTDKIPTADSSQLPSSRSSPSGHFLEDSTASVPTHTPSDYPHTFLNWIPDFRFVFRLQLDGSDKEEELRAQTPHLMTQTTDASKSVAQSTNPVAKQEQVLSQKKTKAKNLEYAVASSDNCACSLCARGVPNGYEPNIGNALQVIMWVQSELRLIDLTRNCSTASYHSIKKDILPFLRRHAGVLLGNVANIPDSLYKTCIKTMTRNSNLFMNFQKHPTGKVSANDQLWKLKPSINPYETFTSAVVPHDITALSTPKTSKPTPPDLKKRPLSPVLPPTDTAPFSPTSLPSTIAMPRPKSLRASPPPTIEVDNPSPSPLPDSTNDSHTPMKAEAIETSPQPSKPELAEVTSAPLRPRPEPGTTHIKIRLTSRTQPTNTEPLKPPAQESTGVQSYGSGNRPSISNNITTTTINTNANLSAQRCKTFPDPPPLSNPPPGDSSHTRPISPLPRTKSPFLTSASANNNGHSRPVSATTSPLLLPANGGNPTVAPGSHKGALPKTPQQETDPVRITPTHTTIIHATPAMTRIVTTATATATAATTTSAATATIGPRSCTVPVTPPPVTTSVTPCRAGDRRCGHCNTSNTVLWRQGPDGKGTLCNACGVRWKRGIIKVTSKRFMPMTFSHDSPERGDGADHADPEAGHADPVGADSAVRYAGRRHSSNSQRRLSADGGEFYRNGDDEDDDDNIDDDDDDDGDDEDIDDVAPAAARNRGDGLGHDDAEEEEEEIDITMSQEDEGEEEEEELLETNEIAPGFSSV